MNYDLIHFPNFKKTFFGDDFKTDILGLFVRVRDELGCRHIVHAHKQSAADVARKGHAELKVIITVPTNWVTRYSTKNYFAVEPIFQPGSPFFDPQVSGVVHDYADDAVDNPELAAMLDDVQKHGLGNLCVAVTARNNTGLPGCSVFTFEREGNDHADFVKRMRPRLLSVSGIIHDAVCGSKAPTVANNLLTPREIDCLRWAANGKTDGEIAEILSIARWTVVTYLQNAKMKLGCSNRTSAVATALSLGIIDMPESSHLI